jgi:hypothetical protein
VPGGAGERATQAKHAPQQATYVRFVTSALNDLGVRVDRDGTRPESGDPYRRHRVTGPNEHPFQKRFAMSILLVVALVAVTIALNGVASAAAPITGQPATRAMATSVGNGQGGFHGSPGDQGPDGRTGARPQVVVVNASIGRADFVQSYGTFVGGFIANDSAVESSPVSLQATCGVVPGGVSTEAAHASAAAYQTTLEQVAALRR